MLVNGSELYKFLDTVFEERKFKRKKETWYYHTPECIIFFTTEKSPYGGQFGHAMGSFVKRVYGKDQEFPPYYKANIKSSLGYLKDREFAKKVFNLEDQSFRGMERENHLRELIEDYAIPFLSDVSSEDGIRKAVKRYKGLEHRIDVATREALGIEE